MTRAHQVATVSRNDSSWTELCRTEVRRDVLVVALDLPRFVDPVPALRSSVKIGMVFGPAGRFELKCLVGFLLCVLSIQVCAESDVQQGTSLMDWFVALSVGPMLVALLVGMVWLIRWIAKHEQWMKGIDDFKHETKEALSEIRADIKRLLSSLPPNVVGSTSPLQLTDLGKEVSECVGAAAWVQQIAPGLLNEVKGKNAYEIQEFCIGYMGTYELAPEQDQSFKLCAYEHGIKLDQVLEVCAIELRDTLLQLVGSEAADSTEKNDG